MNFAFIDTLLLEWDKKPFLPDYPRLHKIIAKKIEKIDSLCKEHYSKKACMTIVKHDIQFILYSIRVIHEVKLKKFICKSK